MVFTPCHNMGIIQVVNDSNDAHMQVGRPLQSNTEASVILPMTRKTDTTQAS